jgi:hypothetical protein
MTTQQKNTGGGASPRWWEATNGAHAVVQIGYVVLLVVGVVVLWLIRLEVTNTHNEDRFAVIESARQERQASDAEMRRALEDLHADVLAVKMNQVRMESKLDWVMKSRNK